ncbi:MAG: mannitol-specific PTS transporter subunit IIC, partial [Bacteroidales bacterium]|nr:mannitol-specific PTS transporter subunit IIC [Bacteroidales bacterium]
MREQVQKFGKFLSGMVMPNIGGFIAWGLMAALFIPTGWIPCKPLAGIVNPALKYLLPLLIAYTGGKMVSGDRGGLMGAIGTIGIIAGTDIPMFIGAMAMGPFAGWVIKRFDGLVEGKVKPGFEMLVNNFSVGILGLICAIIGFFAVGPVVEGLTKVLAFCVQFLISHRILPLVSIFIEPGKVLFLNNAINHGIMTPIGIEQSREAGQSIMFLLEANPGSGLGVLAAYWAFAKGSAKTSAPGAIIIHFFGGIHEIYFPYVLALPRIILAPILGSMSAILFYSLTGAGLVAPASPGSIIAILAMAPKGKLIQVLIGVLIAAVVSFLVASFFVKDANRRGLFDKMDFGSTTGKREVRVYFVCDAGMGSSAMGASRFRNVIRDKVSGVMVSNCSVDSIPADCDIAVCQEQLSRRAMKSAPQAEIVVIGNFLTDPALDDLAARLEKGTLESMLAPDDIEVGLPSESKEEAIRRAGEKLLERGRISPEYVPAMLER